MKHLLTTSLLAFLLSVTVSCDKNDKEPEPPQMPIKNLVMPDESTPRFWGESVTIQGEGFIESSEILIGETDKQKAAIADRTSAGITFVVPEGVEGLHNITLRQAGSDWPLGKLTFAKPVAPKAPLGIVSGIRLKQEYEGEVFEGDFSIEYDENGNITKLGAPEDHVYYYKRQGDKLIVTYAWSDSPQELTDEKLEATLDEKGRAVTAKRTCDEGAGGKVGTENLVFHYSDNGEIKDISTQSNVFANFKSEYTWKDGNIIGSKVIFLDDADEINFIKQISSPYENRTNLDFADILALLDFEMYGPTVIAGSFLPRSSGYLGNMDKNLPEEVELFFDDNGSYLTRITIKYSYEFDDNGRPKSIVVYYSNDEPLYTATITLTISYKN